MKIKYCDTIRHNNAIWLDDINKTMNRTLTDTINNLMKILSWDIPVAKIVLINKCVPFWITNPLIVQPADPYRLLQRFVVTLAAFGPVVWRQHPPIQRDLADFVVHWTPPKRVCSLNRPWFNLTQNTCWKCHTVMHLEYFSNKRIFFSFDFGCLSLIWFYLSKIKHQHKRFIFYTLSIKLFFLQFIFFKNVFFEMLPFCMVNVTIYHCFLF